VPAHTHNSLLVDASPVDASPVDVARVNASAVVVSAVGACSCGRGAVALDELSGLEQVKVGLLKARGEIEVSNSVELAAVMADVESIKRQAFVLSVDLLTLSDKSTLHYADGHRSAAVMLRHVNKLASNDATGRQQCQAMFRGLPQIAVECRAGLLGEDQIRLLARVFANPRVKRAMVGRQEWFLDKAQTLPYKRFQDRVLEWQRIIDEDGTEPAGDRVAKNRASTLTQDPTDLSWELKATFTSVDGTHNNQVHQHYVKALFEADWAEAKARVGDRVCLADLARTDAQRRSDAWTQICADAAASDKTFASATFRHNIVWSAPVYEEMARRFAGAKAKPFDVDNYRCETIDGDPLDPTEAFATSMVNKIRRVIVGAKGVVIDMGTARLFTGLARDAVRMTDRECFWPGCHVPATACETDHLDDHSKGGRTNPWNGGPGCGTHNRWKQKGYRVWRDDHGRIHVYRPNGTKID